MSLEMNPQAFIGSKISLISCAGIRYEGILFNIDSNNSTVGLSKVKSYGTEDRCIDRPIPPRDEVYDYIMFRGCDIKDIHVSEFANRNTPLMSQDYAIIKVSGGNGGYGGSKAPTRPVVENGNYRENNQRVPFPSYQDVRYSSRFRSRSDMVSPGDGYESRRRLYHRTESPMPYYRGRSGSRMFGDNTRPFRGVRRRRGQSATRIPGSDYDFEAANAKMALELKKMASKKKERKDKEGSGDTASDKVESEPESSHSVTSIDEPVRIKSNKDNKEQCYDKQKSFFDKLTSEDTDRVRGRSIRDERKLNSETFGTSRSPIMRNMYYSPNYYYGGVPHVSRMYTGGPRVNRTPYWRMYNPRPIFVGWR